MDQELRGLREINGIIEGIGLGCAPHRPKHFRPCRTVFTESLIGSLKTKMFRDGPFLNAFDARLDAIITEFELDVLRAKDLYERLSQFR